MAENSHKTSSWSPYAEVYDPLKAGSIDGTDVKPHDNAIVRAMNAYYEPDSDIKSIEENTVFVARLSPSTNESTLMEVFSKYGKIKSVKLVRDIVTGHSKCYAFVEYEEYHSAHRAYREANRSIIDGKEVFVDYEYERVLKGWIPRRLGGGFGGRKESGQLRFGGRDRPFRKPISLMKRSNVGFERYHQKTGPRSVCD